jgi:GT2 family glycosyltransferase
MLTRLAVLITSHNRKEKTLAVLRALAEQDPIAETQCEAYLLDDGSSDGTADAVASAHPNVKLFTGNGSHYWNGGMRVVFEKALEKDFDYYVLLNDDTDLCRDALARLMTTHRELAESGQTRAIIVGSIQDAKSGTCSYGGAVRSSPVHPLRFQRLPPTEKPQQCDTFNANCVLIPRSVVSANGILSAEFTHGLGDFDYGLRAQKAGCTVWVAPGYFGTCSRNGVMPWENSELRFKKRWKAFCGPKGIPPAQWAVFARRHAGLLWPVFWASPYLGFLVRQFVPLGPASRFISQN